MDEVTVKQAAVRKTTKQPGGPYLTPTADSVPMGILCDGLRRSPLMLMPEKTPVAVEKNTPNTVKNDSPGE